LGVPTAGAGDATGWEPSAGEAATGAPFAGAGLAATAAWSPPCFFGGTITVAAGADFDAVGASLCPQFPQKRAAVSRSVPH